MGGIRWAFTITTTTPAHGALLLAWDAYTALSPRMESEGTCLQSHRTFACSGSSGSGTRIREIPGHRLT
jgi:hypothetical protein